MPTQTPARELEDGVEQRPGPRAKTGAEDLFMGRPFPCPQVPDTCESRPTRSAGRKAGYLALVLGAVALASLAIAEAVLRAKDIPPVIYSGWRHIGDHAHLNQLGFRGQPIEYGPRDFVVVLLGDSQIEAKACAFEQMPEQRLQYHLRNITGPGVKVFSLGAGGYGQDQELLVLREYFREYRADAVALWQTPENDIWNNMFPTHWPQDGWAKPTFWLEDGRLRGPNHLMGQRLTSRLRVLAALQTALGGPIDEPWERRHFPEPYTPLDYDGPVEALEVLYEAENLDNEKSHFAIALTPPSERMQYGLDLTRALLVEISKEAYRHGAGFLAFNAHYGERTEAVASTTPPAVARKNRYADARVVEYKGKRYRLSAQQARDNLAYANSDVASMVMTFDLDDWRAAPEDSHLNTEAVDLVMGLLAGSLAESG